MRPQAGTAHWKLDSTQVNQWVPAMYRMICLLLYSVAFGLALCVELVAPDPVAIAAISFITIALPALLLVGAISTTGGARAFFVGALFPAGTMLAAPFPLLSFWLLNFGIDFNESRFTTWDVLHQNLHISMFALRGFSGTAWVMSVVTGMLAVGFRWLLMARSKPAGN